MKRIMIEVSYDGTGYCGWQVQPNGITIEEVLNEKLSAFLGEDIRIIGASRTDSGVHALGNIAVFDTETRVPSDKLCYALNSHLPEDIRIRSSRQVADNFHPRKVRSEKTYQYHIQNTRIPHPMRSPYSHLVIYPLDRVAMQEAGNYLLGTHDFKSFCASGSQALSTVRTLTGLKVFSLDACGREITDTEIDPDFRELVIEVKGEGFLYNMVRIISGTLVKAGLGIYPPQEVKNILDQCNRKAAGETLPARGLVLKKIQFFEEEEGGSRE